MRTLAYQYAVLNGIPNPFQNEAAGRDWLDRVLRRHKDKLAIRKPENTSRGRALGFNREVVAASDILDIELSKHKFSADRIFNLDETGLTVVQSRITS